MNPLQATKLVLLTPPAAIVDNASLTVAELDTKGFDYCRYVLIAGTTDIEATVCLITEADVSATSHATVTGLVYGTSTNIAGSTSALPQRDDDKFYVWDIDLRYRKRYLDATITIDDGTAGGFYTVFAILSRGKQTPATAAECGCFDILRV